jgi:hypothetical protein
VTDGAGYRTWALLTRLAKDLDVTVLSLYEDMYGRPAVAPLEESGLKIIPTRCQRRAISKQIRDLQPNIAYLQSWPLHIFLPRTRTILMIDFIGPSLLGAVTYLQPSVANMSCLRPLPLRAKATLGTIAAYAPGGPVKRSRDIRRGIYVPGEYRTRSSPMAVKSWPSMSAVTHESAIL